MARLALATLAFLAASAAPAFAQGDFQEAVVVTASRYRDRYNDFTVPNVTLVRRADFATRNITLSSDTREPNARRAELNEALRGIARQAANGAVSLGLLYEDNSDEGETRVRAFSVEAAMDLLRPGGRPDTSQIVILERTPVAAADTLESVEHRLETFVSAAPKPGRVEYSSGDLELVLVNPPQYRAGLMSAIAADANRIVSALGSGYGARLEGLENPIAWKRAGDLELKLFVPYRMIVLPRGSPQ